LRHGVKHQKYSIDLFYGTPSPGNATAKAKYAENRFSVTRQLHFSLDESKGKKAMCACLAVIWLNYLRQISASEPILVADEEIRPVDVNMHDFMEGMFQVPYRRLKAAMEKQPTDPAGWKALRSDALILAEGSNLLLVRKPEKDVADWLKYSSASRDAGADLIKAAKQNNFEASKEAYLRMLDHCNACHKQFENGKHIMKP
jgi:hypothetical protein